MSLYSNPREAVMSGMIVSLAILMGCGIATHGCLSMAEAPERPIPECATCCPRPVPCIPADMARVDMSAGLDMPAPVCGDCGDKVHCPPPNGCVHTDMGCCCGIPPGGFPDGSTSTCIRAR